MEAIDDTLMYHISWLLHEIGAYREQFKLTHRNGNSGLFYLDTIPDMAVSTMTDCGVPDILVMKYAKMSLCARRLCCLLRQVHTDDNLADVLTKPLGRQSFHRLIKEYLFRSPKPIKDARSTDN
jgi:hypothetical protein